MASDGKVVISTALDNSDIPKGVKEISGCFGGLKNTAERTGKAMSEAFKSAQKEIAAAQKEIQRAESAKMPLTEQAAEVGARLDEAKAKLAELQKQQTATDRALNAPMDRQMSGQEIDAYVDAVSKKPEIDAAVAEQQKLVESLQQKWDSVNDKLDSYDAKIDQATGKIKTQTANVEKLSEEMQDVNNASSGQGTAISKSFSQMKQSVQAFGQTASKTLPEAKKHTKEVSKSAKEIKEGFSGAGKSVRGFGSRLRSIIAGAFVFNVISSALRKVTSYLGEAISASDAMKTAMANLKGAAATAAAPIIQILTPALAALANAAATVFYYFAKLISFFTGKSVSAMSNAAKKVEGAAGSASKAMSSLASFDEIQRLDDKSGGGGGGSGINYDFQGQSAILDAVMAKIQELFAPLKDIDLEPLTTALDSLWKSIKKLGKIIGRHLEWVWFNVLVPLAEWFIEEAAPASVDALTEAFEALGKILGPILNGIQILWEKLQPVINWIKEVAIKEIGKLKEEFKKLGETFEEKGPEIERMFSNLGTFLATVLLPLLQFLYEIICYISEEIWEFTQDEIGYLIDRMVAISDILAGISTGDWSQIWKGLSSICKTEAKSIISQVDLMAASIGIDFDAIVAKSIKLKEDIVTFFTEAWEGVQNAWSTVSQWFDDHVVQPIEETFAPLKNWFGELFGSIGQTARGIFSNIGGFAEGCWEIITTIWGTVSSWFDQTVLQPLSQKWSEFWAKIAMWAQEKRAAVEKTFGNLAEWFGNVFGEAWERVKRVFSTGGQVFTGIKEGILSAFKNIVNKLIDGINAVVARPFNGLNTALNNLKNYTIGNEKPFYNRIHTVSVPQIPYLAQGAVLPANKPFLAMVGDQRHGTNVEAPLATIQEAVALVMEDQTAAILAGFEASVGVQREILEAVLGIQIGDDVIGNAVARYSRKQAVIRGGTA